MRNHVRRSLQAFRRNLSRHALEHRENRRAAKKANRLRAQIIAAWAFLPYSHIRQEPAA